MAQKLHEPVPIDPEQWELAFKPYATDPDAAYDLARRLMHIREFLSAKPPHISLALSALDEAAELLFPFTAFSKSAYDLYRIAIEGHATRAQEEVINKLGILL